MRIVGGIQRSAGSSALVGIRVVGCGSVDSAESIHTSQTTPACHAHQQQAPAVPGNGEDFRTANPCNQFEVQLSRGYEPNLERKIIWCPTRVCWMMMLLLEPSAVNLSGW